MSGEAEAEYWTFPTNPEEFDQDERISFSKLDNKYIAVQDDGTEYEFDEDLKRWIPIIDEALIAEQQRGYMMHLAATDGDADADSSQSGPARGKKRKSNHSNDGEQDSNSNSTSRKRASNRGPPQPKQNTAVYVTGLPPDATVDEVAELFSRKCGVIAEEIDSGRPRVKLYTDADGNCKGDALIVFFKPQSVDMAIMLLDDTDFRVTPSGLTTGKMRVQAADSSYKKTKYDESNNKDAEGSNNGRAAAAAAAAAAEASDTPDIDKYNAPSEGDKKSKQGRRAAEQEKQKIIKKTQKLAAKLADWDDDDPAALQPYGPEKGKAGKNGANRWDKVVILSHMFTLEELEEDPTAILDIKEDIREECAKLGPVTNVVLFDEEEDGIVSVKFQTAEAAEACVKLMHGRAFDGRIVEAFFATGREKFKKSKNKDGSEDKGDDSD